VADSCDEKAMPLRFVGAYEKQGGRYGAVVGKTAQTAGPGGTVAPRQPQQRQVRSACLPPPKRHPGAARMQPDLPVCSMQKSLYPVTTSSCSNNPAVDVPAPGPFQHPYASATVHHRKAHRRQIESLLHPEQNSPLPIAFHRQVGNRRRRDRAAGRRRSSRLRQ
jgi:hypothetical protein